MQPKGPNGAENGVKGNIQYIHVSVRKTKREGNSQTEREREKREKRERDSATRGKW